MPETTIDAIVAWAGQQQGGVRENVQILVTALRTAEAERDALERQINAHDAVLLLENNGIRAHSTTVALAKDTMARAIAAEAALRSTQAERETDHSGYKTDRAYRLAAHAAEKRAEAAEAALRAAEQARIARLKVTEAHAEELMRNFRAVVAERNDAEAREQALRGALAFYRDNWRADMIGDGETLGLSHCFQAPTDELLHDGGDKARAALASPPSPTHDPDHAAECNHARYGATYRDGGPYAYCNNCGTRVL